MTLKEKFVLGLTPEPKKSYRKVGITNGDDVLTDEGMKIYLTYLLNKDTDFKKDVVDSMLVDLEKECK